MENTNLEGRVVDTMGEPLPGTLISVQADDDEEPRVAVTEANGHYRLLGLKAGPNMVTVSLDGFETQKREVNLPLGKTTTVNFTLQVQEIRE